MIDYSECPEVDEKDPLKINERVNAMHGDMIDSPSFDQQQWNELIRTKSMKWVTNSRKLTTTLNFIILFKVLKFGISLFLELYINYGVVCSFSNSNRRK